MASGAKVVPQRARPSSFAPVICPLWVISGHAGLHEEASALPLKADILRGAEIVSFVPLANIDCPDLLVGKLMNLYGSQ